MKLFKINKIPCLPACIVSVNLNNQFLGAIWKEFRPTVMKSIPETRFKFILPLPLHYRFLQKPCTHFSFPFHTAPKLRSITRASVALKYPPINSPDSIERFQKWNSAHRASGNSHPDFRRALAPPVTTGNGGLYTGDAVRSGRTEKRSEKEKNYGDGINSRSDSCSSVSWRNSCLI